jgi:hypothetical protein
MDEKELGLSFSSPTEAAGGTVADLGALLFLFVALAHMLHTGEAPCSTS